MVYEVPIEARTYVRIDQGGPEAAEQLVKEHVANDWLLRAREGASKGPGRWLIKGEVAKVGKGKPFRANSNVEVAPEPPDEEGTW